MQCVQCDAELIAGKQFCHVCGTRAGETCPQCKSVVQAGFRFCPECGTPIGDVPATPSAPSLEDRLAHMTRHIPDQLAEKIRATQSLVTGERKLVTVMFCDLVGSTAIAEGLDPEEYRDLLEGYLEVVFREVYAVEGVVNQLAGDGVMALFGAPIAHEDAPYRGVYAALAIRDALRDMKQRDGAKDQLDLEVRIGVHTGPVVLGGVGNDLKMDYTAIGDTTNLAARLQTAAEPRMVLISEATQRLVRGFFRLAPGRRLEVKGKSDPVTAFEVCGLSDTTTPMAIAEARGLTPLVGRENELAQLSACYDRIKDNFTQIVAIGAEAGSGKSRLLYEFRQRLADEPAVILEARCWAMTQNVPHAPWISMLRDYFGITPGENPEAACTKIGQKIAPLGPGAADTKTAICRMLSLPIDDPAQNELPEDERKRQTFEAVGSLLAHIAAQTPLIIIIEDLHWMDAPSREMLDLAVGTMCEGAEMMVITHRPDHQPFWRTRAAFTQINLLPLSDVEMVEIVRTIAGGQLPDELERGILAKAEGNPFFTEEITRALVEEGYLLRSDGQIRVTRPPSEMRLPGTVEEVVGARLDRLDPPAKRTVQVASVLGRQFQRSQLEATLASEDIDVAASLSLLEERGIIHRKTILTSDEYRFGESLTQDIAYESLLLRQRRELHARVGTMLENMPGDSIAARSALVAHHFSRADDRRRGLAALLRAAEDAEAIPAFPTAAGFYQKAWDLARELLATEEPNDSTTRQTLDAARGLMRMLVLYGWSSDEYDLSEIGQEARALAERLTDDDALVTVLTLWGMGLTSAGRERYDEGVALIREADEVAHRLDDPLAPIRTGRAIAWGAMFDGQFDEASQRLEHAVRELERLGTSTGADIYLSALFIRDRIHLHNGNLTAAESSRKTLELARKSGNRTVQAASATTLAMIAFLRAEYTEARDFAEQSLAIVESTGSLAQVRAVVAIAILARRELGESMVPRHLELLELGPVVGAEPLSAPLIIEAFAALDKGGGAKRFVIAAYKTSGGRLRDAAVLVATADALRTLGAAHGAEVESRYTRAHAVAETLQARGLLATIAHGRGSLAASQGDPAAALTHFQEARARYAELGHQRYVARADAVIAALPDAVQETA